MANKSLSRYSISWSLILVPLYSGSSTLSPFERVNGINLPFVSYYPGPTSTTSPYTFYFINFSFKLYLILKLSF